MNNSTYNRILASYLAILIGFVLVGCERQSGNMSSLNSRSMYSSYPGAATTPYANPYAATSAANPYGAYGANPYLGSTMFNPMYDKLLKEARQDRNDKFRQDFMMMLAMKGTEMISAMMMMKSMGSMMPGMMMPGMMTQQMGMSPMMMGAFNPTAMGMGTGMSPGIGIGAYGGYPITSGYAPPYGPYGQMGYGGTSNYCPTCYGNYAGQYSAGQQMRVY